MSGLTVDLDRTAAVWNDAMGTDDGGEPAGDLVTRSLLRALRARMSGESVRDPFDIQEATLSGAFDLDVFGGGPSDGVWVACAFNAVSAMVSDLYAQRDEQTPAQIYALGVAQARAEVEAEDATAIHNQPGSIA